jgi:hypothetical protein
MTKSPRAAGLMAAICLSFSAIVPDPVFAGNDDDYAKQLWAEGQVLTQQSAATTAKMHEAFERGDWTAICVYAREEQPISQDLYDLSLRMTKLDLRPENADLAQAALAKSQASLESINELLAVPECNMPEDLVDDQTAGDDLDVLNVAVAAARKMDAEGSALFDDKRWSVACSYLSATQSSYANNSHVALELSERFSAENNPQPQLVRLSAELGGLARVAAVKRDIACEKE